VRSEETETAPPVFWLKLDPFQNEQVGRARFEFLANPLPPLSFLNS
jgi:hypothetical protein